MRCSWRTLCLHAGASLKQRQLALGFTQAVVRHSVDVDRIDATHVTLEIPTRLLIFVGPRETQQKRLALDDKCNEALLKLLLGWNTSSIPTRCSSQEQIEELLRQAIGV